MNFNLKLKKIRTFRKMTQKELVDKMAKALDVNPYTLYDIVGRDASDSSAVPKGMPDSCFS